ncbi:MAG: tRNA 2-thiocytidine(32) synthetase TtcA [Candidatus Omnitrophica bacterium]|nr:tRNA 2-thiocytidine(32) synthetase TtcA [Candidatus Omnitrophota bacterium]
MVTINKSQGRNNKPMYFISKKVGKAVGDYKMIADKDKIVVGVSGGMDSITLLKMLKYRQTFAPVQFDILAVHIDFGYSAGLSRRLREFFKKEKVDYYIKKVNIFKKAKSKNEINCFWCSWNRRKTLFETAAKFGFKKVALGHHLDDIIQTVLLNLFYKGEISAMKPKQELFKGKIKIIRPLAYIEKKEILRFARRENDFAYEKCSCPNAGDTKRALVEKVIREISQNNLQIKKNIFRSVQRIKKDYLL